MGGSVPYIFVSLFVSMCYIYTYSFLEKPHFRYRASLSSKLLRPLANYLPIDFESEIDRIVSSARDSGRLQTGQAFQKKWASLVGREPRRQLPKTGWLLRSLI